MWFRNVLILFFLIFMFQDSFLDGIHQLSICYLAGDVLILNAIEFLWIEPDHPCKLLFIISEFSTIEIILFQIGFKRAGNWFVQDVHTFHLAYPRMEKYLFDSDIGSKSNLLIFFEEFFKKVFDLVGELDVGRKGKFLTDNVFLELFMIFGIVRW